MMDLGLFISLQDSDACPVAHSLTKLLLGAIIISGVIVSYVPQIHKMVTSKSSEGLSIWFLLLGSIGCFSTIGNVTLLQYQSILCCRTKWSPGYCFEDTLGVTQVSTQLLGFCVVVAAFYIYYPIDSTIVLVDSGDFEPLESIRSSSEWQRTKGVGMFIIAYAVLVAASLVVVLHIQDPDLFLQARLWWAGVLGLISASSGVVQFVPQIIHTWQAKSGGALSMSMLAIQAPGSFIFAISLAAQPESTLLPHDLHSGQSSDDCGQVQDVGDAIQIGHPISKSFTRYIHRETGCNNWDTRQRIAHRDTLHQQHHSDTLYQRPDQGDCINNSSCNSFQIRHNNPTNLGGEMALGHYCVSSESTHVSTSTTCSLPFSGKGQDVHAIPSTLDTIVQDASIVARLETSSPAAVTKTKATHTSFPTLRLPSLPATDTTISADARETNRYFLRPRGNTSKSHKTAEVAQWSSISTTASMNVPLSKKRASVFRDFNSSYQVESAQEYSSNHQATSESESQTLTAVNSSTLSDTSLEKRHASNIHISSQLQRDEQQRCLPSGVVKSKSAGTRKSTRRQNDGLDSPKRQYNRRKSKEHSIDDADGHLCIRLFSHLTPRFQIIRLLGQGTFGKVVEAFDRQLREKVAIKIIKAIPKYQEAAKIELSILQILKTCDPDNSKYSLKLIRATLLSFAHQILVATSYLHSLGITHTDLKPENLMLECADSRPISPFNSGKKMLIDTRLILIDFGSATLDHDYHRAVVSTRHYRAPEIILGVEWSYPCDVALFQTHDNLEHLRMIEVVLGTFPLDFLLSSSSDGSQFFNKQGLVKFPGTDTDQKSIDYVSHMKPLLALVNGGDLLSKRLLDLLSRMLEIDPDVRITAKEALQHPFFMDLSTA
ncbi:hypothetical protein BSLG_007563 [Batrachochytrium salamandrivorans]|nr:hypothetical protein BSLG_007563 [Batrachochytrium salamandrivorans]